MPRVKNNNKSVNAFTLIEMVIVLVIIGILMAATLFLSGEQIQRVKNKTVKESILAEMQSHYSRNLGSSSYATKMYKTMEVTFSGNTNKIDFTYKSSTGETLYNETFSDKFEIKSISGSNSDNNTNIEDGITLYYSPYNISCKIGSGENKEYDNVTIITRVNDNKDYCFEIYQKNCRLMEMSESKCKSLIDN